MIWVDYIYEDGDEDTYQATSYHRHYGLKKNGQRPIKAHIYSLGSDVLTGVQIEQLEEFVWKWVAKVLHPTKREIIIDKEVYSLSIGLAQAAGYFQGRQVEKRHGQI